MTARARMWSLVAAAMTCLAFATRAGDLDLNVTAPPAPDLAWSTASFVDYLGTGTDDVGTPGHWCGAWKPHTGDRVTFSMRYDGYSLADHVHVYRCAAAHPGGAPGTGHFWDVLVWDRNRDGVAERVEWVPLGPWWT